MAAQPIVEETARAGADAVYRYLERTAEAGPEGVRWRSLSFKDEPQYGADLYNGVAGIAVFLAEYARTTGHPAAAALARRALAWCAVPGQALRHDFPTVADTSLGFGTAGLGAAWLRLARTPAPAAP